MPEPITPETPPTNDPTPTPAPGNKFPRGARPSPAHKILTASRHMPQIAIPAEFAIVPAQLSMWGNSTYGDCVSAEEAYAKAVWSLMCGLPETFISESEVIRWARAHGYLNGADLAEVMDSMASDGMNVGSVNYKDGPKSVVNYADEPTLKSALTVGPVKIAIDANALPSGAGNHSGWWSTSGGRFPNTDHCVGLSGYGSASFLFKALNLPVPAGLDPNTQGYLLFTWSTIGFVTHAWLMGTCVEAWVRNPTTPGQSPTPTPPPPPPPPPPGPTPTPTPGLYALTVGADGSFTFTPHAGGGPIAITPTTTVQELINAMQPGQTMALPPFIVNILKFVCPFAAILPPPIGPILVAICAMLPHAKPSADGGLIITVSPDLAKQINALRSSPRVSIPGLPAEVTKFEDWLRGQASFRADCANCS